ncbi:uncharacterized protein ARMOST_18989 [Armillaria ostoyae]|uniref:Uncharacterized protein n=1 Tax=Armillaria ostoyae TaxID=47428 RepID=A0A284S3A3_ARMOS|nr:uncharacterized protein ARMOST_18989 [Armillaria ostoyae]
MNQAQSPLWTPTVSTLTDRTRIHDPGPEKRNVGEDGGHVFCSARFANLSRTIASVVPLITNSLPPRLIHPPTSHDGWPLNQLLNGQPHFVIVRELIDAQMSCFPLLKLCKALRFLSKRTLPSGSWPQAQPHFARRFEKINFPLFLFMTSS